MARVNGRRPPNWSKSKEWIKDVSCVTKFKSKPFKVVDKPHETGDVILVRKKGEIDSENFFLAEWVCGSDWLVGCPVIKRISDGEIIDIGYYYDEVELY